MGEVARADIEDDSRDTDQRQTAENQPAHDSEDNLIGRDQVQARVKHDRLIRHHEDEAEILEEHAQPERLATEELQDAADGGRDDAEDGGGHHGPEVEAAVAVEGGGEEDGELEGIVDGDGGEDDDGDVQGVVDFMVAYLFGRCAGAGHAADRPGDSLYEMR